MPYSSLSSHMSRTISAPFCLATFTYIISNINGDNLKVTLLSVSNKIKALLLIISISERIFHLISWKFYIHRENIYIFRRRKTSPLFLYLHNSVDIFNIERYISHAISMPGKMIWHFFVIRFIRRFEHEHYLQIW